jgi:hypothetical protein
MKVLIRFLNRISKYTLSSTKDHVRNGRWALTNNFGQVDIKINQANEDHCGCCAKEDVNQSSEDEYYKSFCS